MILIDTNILIYIAQGAVPDPVWQVPTPKAYSPICKLEALGYHKLPADEMHRLVQLFDSMEKLPITDEIVNRAIAIRQIRKVNLGDSIVAATALVHNLELWTANIQDFCDIEDLKLVNPLKS